MKITFINAVQSVHELHYQVIGFCPYGNYET
jgi:hypothetical protein